MSTDPSSAVIAARALLDQADAAARDAALAADAWVTASFREWLHAALAAAGPASCCPHVGSPQVLAALWFPRRRVVLGCPACKAALLELAGPSNAWLCERCHRKARRPWRTPVRVTAAVGPVVASVDLCGFCAASFDLNPPRLTEHQER